MMRTKINIFEIYRMIVLSIFMLNLLMAADSDQIFETENAFRNSSNTSNDYYFIPKKIKFNRNKYILNKPTHCITQEEIQYKNKTNKNTTLDVKSDFLNQKCKESLNISTHQNFETLTNELTHINTPLFDIIEDIKSWMKENNTQQIKTNIINKKRSINTPDGNKIKKMKTKNLQQSFKKNTNKNNLDVSFNKIFIGNNRKKKIKNIIRIFNKLTTPLYINLIGVIVSEVNSIFKRKFDFKILETLCFKELKNLNIYLKKIIVNLDKLHESIKKLEDIKDFTFILYNKKKIMYFLKLKIAIYLNIFEFFKIVEKTRPFVLFFYKAKIKIMSFDEQSIDLKTNSSRYDLVKTFIIVLNNNSKNDYEKLSNEMIYVFKNLNYPLNETNLKILNFNIYFKNPNMFFIVLNFIKNNNFEIFYESIYNFLHKDYNLQYINSYDNKIWNNAFLAYSFDSELFFSLLKNYQHEIYLSQNQTQDKCDLIAIKQIKIRRFIKNLHSIKFYSKKMRFLTIIHAKKITKNEINTLNLTKDELFKLLNSNIDKIGIELDFFNFLYSKIYTNYIFLSYNAVNKIK